MFAGISNKILAPYTGTVKHIGVKEFIDHYQDKCKVKRFLVEQRQKHQEPWEPNTNTPLAGSIRTDIITVDHSTIYDVKFGDAILTTRQFNSIINQGIKPLDFLENGAKSETRLSQQICEAKPSTSGGINCSRIIKQPDHTWIRQLEDTWIIDDESGK